MTMAILMPTRNRPDLIGRAIESCLRQTDPGWVLVIRDDCVGEVDETHQVVKSFKDSRITYECWYDLRRAERNEPLGEARMRNELLKTWERLPAPFACWLDDDDIMHAHRIAVQRAYMEAHPDIDISFSSLGMFDQADEARAIAGLNCHADIIPDVSRYSNRLADYKGNIATPTAMFRPSVAAIPWDENVKYGGSDLLWLFTLVQKGFKIGAVPQALYYLRQHPGRLTRQRDSLAKELVQRDLDYFYAEIERMGGIR